MTASDVLIEIDSQSYLPGDTLSGRCRVDGAMMGDVKTMELSVVWVTEGKATEDMGIIFFQSLPEEEGNWIDPREWCRFSVRLPESPLSYEGFFIKIRWCARARVFLVSKEEILAEVAFSLGDVVPFPPLESKK